MLLSKDIQDFYLYKSPEICAPYAIDCLEWNFNSYFIPEWVKYYTKYWNIGPTEYCVIFSGNSENEFDGVFKFSFKEKTKTLISKGTLVNPKFRRVGVAQKMWDMAIEELQPKKIIASASTRDGLRFLNKTKKRHDNISWKIEETL